MRKCSSNLTNKYNPQELDAKFNAEFDGSNLTNKYNPQELPAELPVFLVGSNLTNKYNPQEHKDAETQATEVQILPINTILKNFI